MTQLVRARVGHLTRLQITLAPFKRNNLRGILSRLAFAICKTYGVTASTAPKSLWGAGIVFSKHIPTKRDVKIVIAKTSRLAKTTLSISLNAVEYQKKLRENP